MTSTAPASVRRLTASSAVPAASSLLPESPASAIAASSRTSSSVAVSDHTSGARTVAWEKSQAVKRAWVLETPRSADAFLKQESLTSGGAMSISRRTIGRGFGLAALSPVNGLNVSNLVLADSRKFDLEWLEPGDPEIITKF